jgi:hypothetical protein
MKQKADLTILLWMKLTSSPLEKEQGFITSKRLEKNRIKPINYLNIILSHSYLVIKHIFEIKL